VLIGFELGDLGHAYRGVPSDEDLKGHNWHEAMLSVANLAWREGNCRGN